MKHLYGVDNRYTNQQIKTFNHLSTQYCGHHTLEQGGTTSITVEILDSKISLHDILYQLQATSKLEQPNGGLNACGNTNLAADMIVVKAEVSNMSGIAIAMITNANKV